MVELGERAVGRLDLHLRRVPLDTEDLVEAPPVERRRRGLRSLGDGGAHEHPAVEGLVGERERGFNREGERSQH